MSYKAELKSIYYDPKHPAGFGTALNLYNAVKHKGVSLGAVKSWLLQQPTYSLHKARRLTFHRRKTVAPGMNHQFQADLVDLSAIKRENSNMKFVLTIIDVFSRFAYAVPIKNKSAEEVLKAFQSVIKPESKLKLLQVDDGREFWNKPVKTFMEENGIKMFSTSSGQKASIVERFNRTLKSRMFKYFTANNTLRYIDVLDRLVESYNARNHRILGCAPKDVNETNERKIWKKQYGQYFKKYYSTKAKFKIGDTVRISKIKKTFEKGYLPNFTKELFVIADVLRTHPTTYFLRDSQDQVLKGAFYGEELVLYKDGD